MVVRGAGARSKRPCRSLGGSKGGILSRERIPPFPRVPCTVQGTFQLLRSRKLNRFQNLSGNINAACRRVRQRMRNAAAVADDIEPLVRRFKVLVERDLHALKGATRKADEEARRMTATVSNLKHASLNDLNFTASKLRSQMADYWHLFKDFRKG